MPGVNGYHGDPYPGGGGQYPGPSRADGYDPYSGHRNPSASRDDPYSYGRPAARDPYPGREDPYSSRSNDRQRHRTRPVENGHAPLSRLAGPVEDPYSRQKKTEDPYSYRKPEDPYSHRKAEDPYYYQRRPEEEPYARVHKDRHRNGAGPVEARDDYRTRAHEPDGAASPFPHYDLDHLATFKVEARHGVMSPMDGIRKLRHMELSSGIWTMRITLVIEPQDLIVIDRASGEDMERFPVSTVSQPTAVTNDDRRDVYNNIVLFTVTEESRKGPQAEMHLFQCIGRPAHEVVDDIKAAKAGKIRGPVPARDLDHGGVSNKIRDFEQHAQRNYIATQGYHQDIPSSQLLRQSMHRDDNESVLSDHTDQEVFETNKDEMEDKREKEIPDQLDINKLRVEQCQQLLNHCFDDIEKFIGRLQSAAEAYRELDNRRKQRVNKRNKHPIGEGMLSMRSRPPPAADFIDVFQKFKLSFNLLARLKPHIHDPNAPELVHFLFTPLSLVVEASKDPRHGTPDIAARVVSPMLTPEAKELLMNCLSSKETSLWHSLGEAWTLSRDEYRGPVPPYNPRFSDGWKPPRSWNVDANYGDNYHYQDNESSYRPGASYGHTDPYVDDPYRRSPAPSSDLHKRALEEYEQEYQRRAQRRQEAERQPIDNMPRDNRRHEVESEQDYPQQSAAINAPLTFEEEQEEFLQQLQEKNAKVAKAMHPRQGKNQKELTIQKGEFVEVIDSSRNWWKVRNAKGEVGHAPYTMLREVPAQQSAQQQQQRQQQQQDSPSKDVRRTNSQSPRTGKQMAPPYSPLYSNVADFAPADRRTATSDKDIPGDPGVIDQDHSNTMFPFDDVPIPRGDYPERSQPYRYSDVADGRRDVRPDEYHNNRRSMREDKVPISDQVRSPKSPDRLIHNMARNPLQENITKELKRVQSQNVGHVTPRVGVRPKMDDVNIDAFSSESAVQQWLNGKGFSSRLKSAFRWYNGLDMFQMSSDQILDLAGDESARLESLLKVQKKIAGYDAPENGELEAVLRERKQTYESEQWA